jgi:hypothetical protein
MAEMRPASGRNGHGIREHLAASGLARGRSDSKFKPPASTLTIENTSNIGSGGADEFRLLHVSTSKRCIICMCNGPKCSCILCVPLYAIILCCVLFGCNCK